MKIRSSTKTWFDEGKPVVFQPTLRFRAPTNGSATDPTNQKNARDSKDATVDIPNPGEEISNDNWVARDAVNLKHPLRDPLPPTGSALPVQQPPVKEQAPATEKAATTPVPGQTQRPLTPKAKPSSPTLIQERVPSATLLPPKATTPQTKTPRTDTTEPNNHVGDLNEDSLQLVTPSEINELRSFGAPTAKLSESITDEPTLEDSVDSAQETQSELAPDTAVDSMLSIGDDEPSLNTPLDLNPTKNDREVSCEGETETASKSVKYRPLKINRDGSLKDTDSQQDLSGLHSSRESDNRMRETEGNNEPLQKHLDASTPALNDEESQRLNVVPLAPPRSAEDTLPAEELDYTGRPTGPIQVATAVRRLQPMMKSCLSYYHGTPDSATERSNWGMMHQIMVYGVDTKIIAGRNTHNAIAWIAGNNACRGQRILTTSARGIAAKSGVGLQGHQGQLLAILSICGVPDDYPLYVSTKKYYVRDLVREEMATCKSGEELTFTLIGLSHYLDTDQQWRSADGQTWNFERLVREELSQPIVGAACGGTHRLMGFAHALRNRRSEGKEISGQWLRAQDFLDEFVTFTYQLQNRDGSMSTNWFEGPEDNGDLDRKVQTTGHMVEWLLTNTPDDELQNPRLVAAIQFLLSSLNSDRKHDWQIGPKGHALRSLAMYYDRVYRNNKAWAGVPATARSTSSMRR